jgi:hypothetical protein
MQKEYIMGSEETVNITVQASRTGADVAPPVIQAPLYNVPKHIFSARPRSMGVKGYVDPRNIEFARSNQFATPGLALSACPHKTSQCGAKYRTFDGTNDDTTAVTDIVVSGLTKDNSCSYLVKTTCGMPTVTISKTSTLTSSSIGISYLEWVDEFNGTSTLSNGYPTPNLEAFEIRDQFKYPQGTLGQTFFDGEVIPAD